MGGEVISMGGEERKHIGRQAGRLAFVHRLAFVQSVRRHEGC